MSPEERPERSKTGDYDVSLSLDSPWMTSWSHTLFCLLKDNHPEAPLWDFDYNEYSKVFKKVVEELGLDITPYQTRHSGPSIDRARGYRSQGEVQKRGQWEGLEVSGSLREVGKPPNEPADTLPAMRGKPWGNHVRIQKGARVWKRQKQQRYVMDLFAGKGGVSAACQALGFHAKQWDIIHGPEHDLTDKRVLKRLLQEIRRGRVLAVMMAPVCTSFSRARDRTKVIRNHRFPWGIPRRFLSEKEYLSIRLGNTLFRACFAIIEECEKQQISLAA